MEKNRHRLWLASGAISAGVAVITGAFGAHQLKTLLTTDLLAIFETAARYQLMHALALLVVGILGQLNAPSKLLQISGSLFLVGTMVFCGSLYALALSGIRWLGAITPIGGVAFIAAWSLLAVAVWRGKPLSSK